MPQTASAARPAGIRRLSPPQRYNTLYLASKVVCQRRAAAPFGIPRRGAAVTICCPPIFPPKIPPFSLRRIVEMIDICYNAVSLLDGERLYRNRNGMDCPEGVTTMADRKNDQERDELFRRIYKIATDLVHAGHVAEWDFKSYVLGTMFYRYISENFAAYINKGEIAAALARGEINPQFDYAKLPDDIAEPERDSLVQEKGFFILPSELFCNVLARADKDENLNETRVQPYRKQRCQRRGGKRLCWFV